MRTNCQAIGALGLDIPRRLNLKGRKGADSDAHLSNMALRHYRRMRIAYLSNLAAQGL